MPSPITSEIGTMLVLKTDMMPFLLKKALPALLLSAAAGCAFAQTTIQDGLKVRELHPRPIQTPFPLDQHFKTVPTLDFIAPEQISAADKSVVEGSQEEIGRRADLQGFALDNEAAGAWGYEQAVCPALPNHVILEYSRDNGKGDLTLFAAVLPRGEGHVRVIPVKRRSYSLFTPSSMNAITINDFNHIVKEEGTGLSPDWFTLGLCYSALAGGHVRAALQPLTAAEEHYPRAVPAKLMVSYKGGAEVRYADETPNVPAMQWVLTFAQSGRLMKVKHSPASELDFKPVNGAPMEVKTTPTKQSIIEVMKPGN